MKMTSIAAIAIAALAASAFADSPAAPAAPGTPKAEEKKARPVADDMVSPNAANAVDEQDLIKRLTGEGNDSPAPGNSVKKLDEVLERMGASADLLGKRDPGEITQETQHRIVVDLEVLIEEAMKQEQKGGGKSQQQKPGEAASRQQPGKGKQPGQSSGGSTAAQDDNIRDGQNSAALGESSLIDVRNDQWSRLPARERDIIVNAQNAQVLPTYKTPMERFYENLAKPDKPK